MKWEKIEKTVNSFGTTITYAAQGTDRQLLVQSRKRPIPHANGVGTWDYTTYFVLANGETVKECWRLKEAQEYAEAWWTERSEK